MQFDDFLRQQAHGPAGAAIRRGRAGERGEAGVEPAVKGDGWRFGAGFTNEGGVKPLLHEALFEVLDGAGGNTQGGGHIRHFPGFLGMGADVAQ